MVDFEAYRDDPQQLQNGLGFRVDLGCPIPKIYQESTTIVYQNVGNRSGPCIRDLVRGNPR